MYQDPTQPGAASGETDTRPDDLLPVADAAELVQRSVSSVRAWVRAGDVTGYRENPSRSNSRLLVSKHALLTYAGVSGKDPDNQHNPNPAPVVDSLRQQVATLTARAELLSVERDALTRERDVHAGRVDDLRTLAATHEAQAQAMADRVAKLEAELAAERAWTHRTWLDKVLGRSPSTDNQRLLTDTAEGSGDT